MPEQGQGWGQTGPPLPGRVALRPQHIAAQSAGVARLRPSLSQPPRQWKPRGQLFSGGKPLRSLPRLSPLPLGPAMQPQFSRWHSLGFGISKRLLSLIIVIHLRYYWI